MSKIILIIGDLAAGKSTLAKSLSSIYGSIFLSKDSLKETLVDDIDFSNREENRKISIATVDVMIKVLEEIIKVDNNAVLEANFRADEINRIEKLAEKYSSHLETIYLYGDYKVLYERFLDRLPHRHRAHLSAGLDKNIDAYIKYVNDIREDVKNANCLKIDMTNLNKEQVVEKVKNYLTDKHF